MRDDDGLSAGMKKKRRVGLVKKIDKRVILSGIEAGNGKQAAAIYGLLGLGRRRRGAMELKQRS